METNSLVDQTQNYQASILIPTRNEAAVLPCTVPRLLSAAKEINAEPLWICNDCSDNSAHIIREITGKTDSVIEIPTAGKPAALNAGDRMAKDLFPRFYIDADAVIDANSLKKLLTPLICGDADLTGARQIYDTSNVSNRSSRIARCWMGLPHAQATAFSVVIGLSKAGRALWNEFPELSGDDIFISSQIPEHRRKFVPEASVLIPTPKDFWAWVRTRARWRKGELQLIEQGRTLAAPPNQRAALISQLTSPSKCLGAIEYVLARLLSRGLVKKHINNHWTPER